MKHLPFAISLLPITAIAQQPALYWGHAYGGPGNHPSYSNTCNDAASAPDGRVFITGAFANNIDLDPGPGNQMVTTTGQTDHDAFMACYDSLGIFQWKQTLVSGAITSPGKIERQPGGDLVIGGYHSGTTDFDPGPGVVNLTGSTELFFARYTDAGALVWAKSFGAVSGVDKMNALEVDASGNIWIAGRFGDTLDLDPGPGVAQFLCTPGDNDGFMAMYTPDGEFVWGHVIGAVGADEVKAIAFTASGDAVVTGRFYNTIDVEPGLGTVNIAPLGGGNEAFVAFYTTGGQLSGAFSFGGGASEVDPAAIAVDANGDIIVCGEVNGNNGSLVPGEVAGTVNTGSDDWGFLAKYTIGGGVHWTDLFTSTSAGVDPVGLEVESDGEVWWGGSRSTDVDADPGPGIALLTGEGAFAIKVHGGSGALLEAVEMGTDVGDLLIGMHMDDADHLYFTGGGDVWNFNGSTVGNTNNAILLKSGECLPPQIVTQPAWPFAGCSADPYTFELEAIGSALNYAWTENGIPVGTNADSLAAGPWPGAGVYIYQCDITGLCGAVSTGQLYFTILQTPDPQLFEASGILYCTATADYYWWYLNGAIVASGFDAQYTPTASGIYTVVAVNGSVCVGGSQPYNFIYTGIAATPQVEEPILVSEADGFMLMHIAPKSKVRLLDLTGAIIEEWSATANTLRVATDGLAQGVYLVLVGGRALRLVK